MCGIFGAIETGLTQQVLSAAGNTLAHRGPDACGTFLDSSLGVGLVHRRLSVLDLEGGDQPLYDRDRDIVLVCNGEIYDFERIRSQLEDEGYSFSTASDSEVIINLYLKHGLDCLAQLRGEFAFLLLDKRVGRLVAGRDRFGIKPLYFSRTDSGGWCFASEAKAMAASGLTRLVMDPEQFTFNENCSLFRGVYFVPPASALVFNLSDLRFDTLTYWHPDFPIGEESEPDGSLHQWVRTLDQSLAEAVRLRMRADVPVGVYLSGGIDSAVVAAKASQEQARRPCAFTVSFADVPEPFNEETKARRIAEHLGLEHHVLKLDTATLWDNLEKCLWHNEAPIGDLAPVAKCMLSALAAEHVKVVLTGEGADEVLLGYRVFNRALSKPVDNDNPHQISDGARTSLRDRIQQWLIRPIRGNMQLEKSPGGEPQDAVLAALPEQSRDRSQITDRSTVVRLQYRRLKTHLHRVILCAYGDRMEMAHSIEGRVPFLDHVLFDVVKRIPLSYKIDSERHKIILRELAVGLVPEEVVNRPKWRFSTPHPAFDLGHYESLDRLVDQYLSRAAIRRTGLFTWTRVSVLWGLRRFRRFQKRVDRWLFSILCLQILHHLFEEPRLETYDKHLPQWRAARSSY